ncbi:MAG: site-specific DNA-methyltransferase [Chitinophagaceae bacterium]|nr:site-specific DNA-methyltransferase [Chitinophagaceae bacterium]
MILDLNGIIGKDFSIDKEVDTKIEEQRYIKNVQFVLGDNMALLRWMKEEVMMGFFHLGIVDPPYGIEVGNMKLGATAKSKERNYDMGDWDASVPSKEYWDLLKYVCRNLIVWGGNYFTKEFDWSGRCFDVWDKKNNGMSFADAELALTTFDKSARIIPKSRTLNDKDGEKRHPTHKPSYLYEYLHLQHNIRDLKVLDTHGGSLSHAIASYRTGAKLLIIEKNESYYKSGIKAFEDSSKAGLL